MDEKIASGSQENDLFGFIVIADRGDAGYTGGYLCTNQDGVPVEFRYTSPVKPTRRQELLYGRTLKPQLLGKHIAGVLLRDTGHRPMAVLTDESAVLLGLEGCEPPVLQVLSNTEQAKTGGAGTSQVLETPCGAVTLAWRGTVAPVPELLERLRKMDLRESLERAKGVLNEIEESSAGVAGGA